MSLAWAYLLTAGVFEIGWPLGLKISSIVGYKVIGIILAVISMVVSGALLWLSLKSIPIGTAYAVWTGIGAAGTFVVGVVFFGDALSLLRGIGVLFIVGGVVMLKLGHQAA